MADNLTDSEERRLLDLSLTNGTVYLALFTVAPDDAGAGGTEVTGGGYARQAMPFANAAATDGSGISSKANSAAITFPAATAAWGTLVAFGIMDAATGGTMRWHRNMTSQEQRAPMPGDVYTTAAGALTFGLS
jgi:hypothetical protein